MPRPALPPWDWLTAHCRNMTTRFLQLLTSKAKVIFTNVPPYVLKLVSVEGIAPASVAVFLAIVRRQIRNYAVTAPADDISKVSGLYGPGTYYAWVFNSIVAICESLFGHQLETVDTFIATLTAEAAPFAASIGQLQCVAAPASCVQLQRDAADRLIMLSWILDMHYLQQKMVDSLQDRQEPGLPPTPPAPIHTWRPSRQTFVRITVLLMDTVAMVAYDIQRGTLGKRLELCLVPYLVFIVFPLMVICYRGRVDRATTVFNIGTIVISVVYIFTPYKYRYDPHSPAAPISASKLMDPDQRLAMVVGCFCLIPHILKRVSLGGAWRQLCNLMRHVRGQGPQGLGYEWMELDTLNATDTEYRGAGDDNLAHLFDAIHI